MQEIKAIVAKNIAQLRSARGMTQSQLAEYLNYSDKAVSKWERGESLPDVAVLTRIADLFQVPLDYLVRREHPSLEEAAEAEKPLEEAACEGKTPCSYKLRNHGVITAMSVLVVWLIASLLFVICHMSPVPVAVEVLIFVYAIPASIIVWLVFNSVWFNRRRNFLIISALMWTTLLATFLTLYALDVKVWLLFLLGVPGQIIIFMWSRLRFERPDAT